VKNPSRVCQGSSEALSRIKWSQARLDSRVRRARLAVTLEINTHTDDEAPSLDALTRLQNLFDQA